jgi:hypothetical protein
MKLEKIGEFTVENSDFSSFLPNFSQFFPFSFLKIGEI